MAFAVNYHRWILDELEPWLGKEVVEVGAARGDVSAMLLESSLERLYSFEPAANLFPTLAAKLEGESRARAFNDFFTVDSLPAPVDTVVYVNVMEHIEDDRAEVAAAYAAIKPGGHLLVFVPALQWLYSPADRKVGHFRRYHKAALGNLARDAGFVGNVRHGCLAVAVTREHGPRCLEDILLLLVHSSELTLIRTRVN